MQELQREKERMEEQAYLKFRGKLFLITPITLGEEVLFYNDCNLNFIPHTNDGTEPTDADKLELLEAMFMRKDFPPKVTTRKIFNKIIKDNYSAEMYYKDTKALGLVQWIERKVYLNGKNIRFYDLENKYGLSKIEIYDMIEKFYDLSNFSQHLQQKKRTQK